MIYVKYMIHKLYIWVKVGINYRLDRIIDLCDMVLMDAYRFPWTVVQRAARRIARYVGDISWLLRDFPRLSTHKLVGADWTIIFVGGEVGLREICHLFFEEGVDQQEVGRIALWRLSTQTRQWLAEGVDLVVCELSRIHPRPPRAALTFTVPTSIQQIFTIPETLIPSRRGIRRIVDRAQKAGFTYRFSQSKADFGHFYYHMYLPFVKSRHGDLVQIAPYRDQWRRRFTRGGLILVNQDGKSVAGVLCYLANDTCFAIEGGILEANPHLFRQGIYTFLVWCALVWGHDQGAKIFDLGGTRARRSNGRFTFKSGWGAQVARRRRIYGVWRFLAQNLSPSLQDHLNELGLISEIDGKFYGVSLSIDDAVSISEKVKKELLTVKKQGLDGVLVVSTNSKPVIYNVTPQPPD